MLDYENKIDKVVEDNEHEKGNIVTLHRDSSKVITLSDHSSKGENFGTFRLFYNNTVLEHDFERNITEGSILQDLPQTIFKDVSEIFISLSMRLPEITEESLLDIKCEKVYPHSQYGIAMFKTHLKIPKN